MNDIERKVTIWSRFRGDGYWVIERSYPLRYIIDAMDMPAIEGVPKYSCTDGVGREYAWFEGGKDPNKNKEVPIDSGKTELDCNS
jgi:hypothetical protein